MQRSPGWSRLAATALELAGLAAAVRFMESGAPMPLPPGEPVAQNASGDEPADASEPSEPAEQFILEDADQGATAYRASDGMHDVLVGMYADGRIRVGDAAGRRFAGLLSHGQADLVEMDGNAWCEVFVRATPEGRTQLEFRGGPYAGRVLGCEPL